MAIRIRRGNQIDFDKNKLVQGELAIVLDAGELHFCYGAGNTKRLATKEDLQEMLDMSETSYSALIQLIADLENDPNELTNILSNISALQSNKADKSYVDNGLAEKVDKASITNQIINDQNKINSAAVNYSLKQSIDALNNNFAQQLTAPTVVSERATSVTGGFIKIGKLVFVSIQFTAAVSGATALLFEGLPPTIGAQPLNAMNTTDNALAVCFVNIRYLNIGCTSGKVYSISGSYISSS